MYVHIYIYICVYTHIYIYIYILYISPIRKILTQKIDLFLEAASDGLS